MDIDITLFILRLISGGLLLAFVGLLFYYLQKDTAQLARRTVGVDAHGIVHVLPAAGAAQQFPLQAVTTIGRALTSNIVLNTDYASSQHAFLTRRDHQWWLEDLGSRNGTRLNDMPVTETTVVSNGDIITIGDINLKLEL